MSAEIHDVIFNEEDGVTFASWGGTLRGSGRDPNHAYISLLTRTIEFCQLDRQKWQTGMSGQKAFYDREREMWARFNTEDAARKTLP